jgi:hypothetical protein
MKPFIEYNARPKAYRSLRKPLCNLQILAIFWIVSKLFKRSHALSCALYPHELCDIEQNVESVRVLSCHMASTEIRLVFIGGSRSPQDEHRQTPAFDGNVFSCLVGPGRKTAEFGPKETVLVQAVTRRVSRSFKKVA